MDRKQRPKYIRLADRLREGIRSGAFPCGSLLPSENQLTQEHGVSRQTVRQALGLLEQEGLIQRRQGSGSRVRNCCFKQGGGNVGVVTTYISEYIFPGILRGIEEALAREQYAPILAATGNRMDNERRILEDFLARPMEGLIVEGTKTALPNSNLDLYRRLEEEGVPVVFLHSCYPDLKDPDYVVADDEAGGAEAVKHLLSRGHRRIAGIFKSDDIQGHRRCAGFLRAMGEAALPVPDDRVIWYHTGNRREWIPERLAAALEGCTALVCYNDQVAVQVLEWLGEQGRRTPADVALVSFDNSVYSDMAPVKITSFSIREHNIGGLAVEKLLSAIRGERAPAVTLPWRLEIKDST